MERSTTNRRTTKAMDIEALPVPDVDNDVVNEKKARRGIKQAGFVLAAGLALEVAATLWTLGQAVSLGVFHEADCGILRVAAYLNDRVPRECKQVRLRRDRDYPYYDFYEFLGAAANLSEPVTYKQCPLLEHPPVTTAMQLCDCWSPNLKLAGDLGEACKWTAARASAEDRKGLCLAKPLVLPYMMTNLSSYLYTEQGFDGRCTPVHPPGAGKATVGLMMVGLGVELVETAAGYVHLSNPLLARAGLLAVGSVFEATGIITFHLWLVVSKEYWYMESVFADLQNPPRVLFLMNFVIAALVSACLGVLAGTVFYFSEKASRRLPYLGVIGNALIWLGSALTEVMATLYLTWRRQGPYITNSLDPTVKTWSDFGSAIVALIVMEVLALMVVLTARVAFTRGRRMLLRLKGSREFKAEELDEATAAAEPGTRQPSRRVPLLFCVLFTVIFCCLSIAGWPPYVDWYNKTLWEGLDPRDKWPNTKPPADEGS